MHIANHRRAILDKLPKSLRDDYLAALSGKPDHFSTAPVYTYVPRKPSQHEIDAAWERIYDIMARA